MVMDQAQRLREFLQQKQNPKRTRVIAVTSGKGGVGKSNFSVNFALALTALGQKVVIIDLDLGMANVDILLGLTPRYNILDMTGKNLSIWDIMEQGPRGLQFIAGGSGLSDVLELGESGMERILGQMEKLHGYADTILLDMGAGISQDSLRFILAADEVMLITTPEPTAITDAYSMLKILHAKNPSILIKLMINRVINGQEGKQVAEKIRLVAKKFLQYEVSTFGYLVEDSHILQAVKKQAPFCLEYPNCKAAKGLKTMAEGFLSGQEFREEELTGMKGFIHKLIHLGRQ